MHTLVALFRGINVGGRHLLPMKELVALFETLGFEDVKTCIQSGNVVFASRTAAGPRLAGRIGAAIGKRHGFEPDVLLLRAADIETAMASNPWPEAVSDPKTLHVGFLAATPSDPDLAALESVRKDSERFRLVDRVFYLHAPEGVARSRLAARAERMLGVAMTVRNWRTVCRIRDMLPG